MFAEELKDLIAAQMDHPETELKVKQNKDGSVSFILFESRSTLKYKGNCKSPYLTVNTAHIAEDADISMESFVTRVVKSDNPDGTNDRVRICDPASCSRESLSALIGAIVRGCSGKTGLVFDICSRYKECSDAGECVIADRNYAKTCRYRQKLKKGIVFYGEKRNVNGDIE